MAKIFIKNKHCLILLIILTGFIHNSSGQTYNIYNNSSFDPVSRELYRPGQNIHTSIRPYRLDELNKSINIDSIVQRGLSKPSGKLNIWQRFINDDLFRWQKDEARPIMIRINPLFNFEAGKESKENKNIWSNTRAIMIEGELGKKISFYGDFYENQAVFPAYIHDFIEERGVAPGQGRTKIFKNNGFDFSQSTGYFSLNANELINLQLGFGTNFIGDGYRSLLLSDNTYSYPFFKVTATFWNLKYLVMLAQFQHIDNIRHGGDIRYEYKYGIFHYLSWNIGSRFSLGLFENVIWAAEDPTGYRGIDFNYLIPTTLYRPIEYGIGSPDNVTIGLNLKLLPWENAALYGQIVINEFKLDEIMSGDKWWANKQGFQLGFKNYNFLNIPNLDFQAEYNQVRPFTYSHYSPITNYGHFNQELAHPLAANFREGISFLSYRLNRWYLNLEGMYAMHGKDYYNAEEPEDKQISWGGDIFISNMQRYGSHGHFIGQGLKTTIKHAHASVSFLINPKNNMNIGLGIRIRNESNEQYDLTNSLIYFALRTSLKNIYLNF